jgi:sugar phosphate isomerase/epimerase
MSVNRREFFAAAGAAGMALAAPAGAADAPAERKEGVLRISAQEGFIPGKSLEEKLDKMEKWGIEGLEVGSAIGREESLPKALKDRKVKMSAICMGSMGGHLVGPDKEARDKAAEQMKRHLTAAGAVGSTGCVYVPCFNGEQKLPNQEVRKILLDVLPAIGEHAVSANSRILLEPLNRGEAYFLRQLADGAAIARDCKSEGVCLMGDFYHMAIEEPSNTGAFISAGRRLHHVHLASRTRVAPGQDIKKPGGKKQDGTVELGDWPDGRGDDVLYLEGFIGLKYIGYQDFCSFECGCRGDKEVEIPKVVAFLRETWDKAKI